MENMTDTQQTCYHPTFFLAEPTPDDSGLEGQIDKGPGSVTQSWPKDWERADSGGGVCLWEWGWRSVPRKDFALLKKIDDLKKESYSFVFWILFCERVMLIAALEYAALRGRPKNAEKPLETSDGSELQN